MYKLTRLHGMVKGKVFIVDERERERENSQRHLKELGAVDKHGLQTWSGMGEPVS